jgi:hypothetical protein
LGKENFNYMMEIQLVHLHNDNGKFKLDFWLLAGTDYTSGTLSTELGKQ